MATVIEAECKWLDCHAHSAGDWCNILGPGWRVKDWRRCNGLLGKSEKCCNWRPRRVVLYWLNFYNRDLFLFLLHLNNIVDVTTISVLALVVWQMYLTYSINIGTNFKSHLYSVLCSNIPSRGATISHRFYKVKISYMLMWTPPRDLCRKVWKKLTRFFLIILHTFSTNKTISFNSSTRYL